MRTIWIKNIIGDSFIQVCDRTKQILKIKCPCETFQYNCIHKVGTGYSTKYYSTPCIHTAREYQELISEGYTLKIPTIEKGPMKLTPKIRDAILEVWGKECWIAECNETEDIDIHRLIPGYKGGPYSILNGRPCCNKHHKLIHSADRRCK